MGIVSEAQKKFTPNCRYGHGDLNKLRLLTFNNQPRGTIIPTYFEIPGSGPVTMDGNGYSIVLYRCDQCGYTELFDDGIANG